MTREDWSQIILGGLTCAVGAWILLLLWFSL